MFLAVAQTGSLRRAARALQLGQPTVVKTVARVRRVSEWIRAVFRDARPALLGRHPPATAARNGTH